MSCPICRLPIADSSRRPVASTESRQCPFCSTTFSRADGAKRHAKRCAQRGNRALDPGKRGRKPISCDRCSRLKLHCNAGAHVPCASCVSRQLECKFSRYCTDAAHRQPVSEDSQQRSTRVPLAFLLNATDEQQDFITERAVAIEPEAALLGVLAVDPPSGPEGQAFDLDDLLAGIDSTITFPPDDQLDLATLQPYVIGDLHEADLLGSFVWSASQPDPLRARIDLLETELQLFAHPDERFRDASYVSAFRRLFTVTNVRRFSATFCRKRHYRFVILHWPTLIVQDVPLPLLLVIALTGASYTYAHDCASEDIQNARSFYRIADAYIFSYLNTALDRWPFSIVVPEAIQICQAALLMYGLDTLQLSDEAMQCIATTRRLPLLVTALRQFHFLGCRHQDGEDWQAFLRREQIIRLVAWMFCVDCLATLLYNNSPLCSMSEMTGDLPCETSIWDAAPPSDLASISPIRETSSACLRDIIANLINEKAEPKVALDRIPLFHLHVAMFGLQQIIFNMHVSMALPDQSGKLLRAFGVWRDLWARAFDRIPHDQRAWLGISVVMPAFEKLTRKMIESIGSPEAASSRYLQRIPSYSARSLHEFILHFVLNDL